MPSIAQAVYTATATSTGGRTGTTESSDGDCMGLKFGEIVM